MKSARRIRVRKSPLLPIDTASASDLIVRIGGVAMAKARPGSISQDRTTTETGTVIELPVCPRPRKSKPSGAPRFHEARLDVVTVGFRGNARSGSSITAAEKGTGQAEERNHG